MAQEFTLIESPTTITITVDHCKRFNGENIRFFISHGGRNDKQEGFMLIHITRLMSHDTAIRIRIMGTWI